MPSTAAGPALLLLSQILKTGGVVELATYSFLQLNKQQCQVKLVSTVSCPQYPFFVLVVHTS